jgi:uncharacterized protein YjbI with pentapeptide repeats
LPDARKVDPFDVEALERAVNDSATRVSAIWISFLVFSLYLLIAATTVTQRQLLLAEPVQLPVLNIALPLWGFFFLAPILFVILHVYVLLQVLLLGRTTAAYNTAVARTDLSPEENASLRQRLANTLFAQIFAGSPREREGFVGLLLTAIVWITLAIGPILILLAFQFSFLAYHSHIATWTHRLLILVELAAFFLIWPLALDARKDLQWPMVEAELKHLIRLPLRLSGLRRRDGSSWSRLREQAIPLSAAAVFIPVSLSLATFPGEPHVNLLTRQPLLSVQCTRWIQQQFNLAQISIDLRFDRLVLPQVDVVDDDKLANIEKHASERKLAQSQGKRTQDFRNRDFNCADVYGADLRRVDLTGAFLLDATLYSSALDGALLDSAHLQGAHLDSAQLQGASLKETWLQNAWLSHADLRGASLDGAQLQGVSLDDAKLQGASLLGARLQAASLDRAQLQGASLEDADLQGASLIGSELQGATIGSTQLRGAYFEGSQLQGTDLRDSAMRYSRLSRVYVWGALVAKGCGDADVSVQDATVISNEGGTDEQVPATSDAIAKYVERSVAGILDASKKEEARAQMLAGLKVTRAANDAAQIKKIWSDCEAATKTRSRLELDDQLAHFLRNLTCNARDDRKAVAEGIVRNWILQAQDRVTFNAAIARGLLGEDGEDCAATRDLDKPTRQSLRDAVDRANKPPSSTAGQEKLPAE